MGNTSSNNGPLDRSLAHGRAALYFYTGERGHMFRVFLFVLTVAAAGSMISLAHAHAGVAISIAILMGFLSMLFKLIDYRSRTLVHHAEALVLQTETQLAEESGLEECLLIAKSQEHRDMSHTILYQASYTITIILSVFLAIFAYGNIGS